MLQRRWKEVIEGTAICAVRLASPREPEEDLRIRHRALTAARRAQSLIMRRDYFDVWLLYPMEPIETTSAGAIIYRGYVFLYGTRQLWLDDTGGSPMTIRSFDHVAIPIQNTDAMLTFYRALGFGVNEREHFYSVHFGDQKINFHGPERWQSGRFTLRGPTAVPGCGDFCFVWDGSAESLRTMLDQAGAEIIEGPVERMGGRNNGRAKGTSLYMRDPDSNLLEFMIYPDASSV